VAEYQRDLAQQALDQARAIKRVDITIDGFRELTKEYESAARALAELIAVKADTETEIFKRARQQHLDAVRAVERYVFALDPDTPDAADMQPEK